ncbi:MAG: D-glycero-beta-D-manno-heptose 1-phosphate adenylyltransferase [Candidatus Aceula meridiana]|nr:D-glycero-beta-D-manno-heptose 1-phosphate adenylyltransferase [Candidatus Aceula meridiana]
MMNTKSKILSIKTLSKKIPLLKKRKKKIVLTNGCFDILHLGHARYLEAIKKEGHIVVVAVNSDASVKKIKGCNRPIQSQHARAGLVASLACVDYVVIFNEPTPLKVVQALKPDVLVKGADWKGKVVVGEDIVKANGGKVWLVKYLPGFSTTRLIQKIKSQCVR